MSDLDLRNQRVMAFLRGLHGETPERCYLNPDDLRLLMLKHQFARATWADLDFTSFVHKYQWQSAVESSIRQGLDPAMWPFWMAARQAYLETGGEYRLDCVPPEVGRRR